MRPGTWSAILLLLCSGLPYARADDSAARGKPPIEVGGSIPAAPATPCVGVRIGTATAGGYDCLNAQLAQQANQAGGGQSAMQAAVGASQPSSPTQLNLYNQAATRERLGGNFGKSPLPLRPSTVYHDPLTH